MSRQLVARFSIDPVRIKYMLDVMDQRTGSVTLVKIGESTVHNGASTVSGPAQDIMFLIGEVAANGEAGLIEVHELT